VVPVVWRPFEDAAVALPLYPSGVEAWLPDVSRRPGP